jgi:hypothetical protein
MPVFANSWKALRLGQPQIRHYAPGILLEVMLHSPAHFGVAPQVCGY